MPADPEGGLGPAAPTEPAPQVAVVIPTRDREQHLGRALAALREQTLPPERFEVLVVRDATQAGPFAQVPEGLRVRYLTSPGSSGPTAKRNVGWRATNAPVIAFTDDDCRPVADWLERLLEAHAEDAFSAGRTEMDQDDVHLLRGFARTRVVDGPSPWFPGCNLSYPRALLERLGGLDETFHFGGEDTDLALRAQASGAAAAYLPDAVVRHAVLPRTFRDAVREAAAWPSLPLLIARHPEQRRHLYAGVFRNKSHGTLLLAVAGATALRRRPSLALAATLPYLGHKLAGPLSDAPDAGARLRVLAYFPAWAVIDVVEVWATVRGGVRHRALMA